MLVGSYDARVSTVVYKVVCKRRVHDITKFSRVTWVDMTAPSIQLYTGLPGIPAQIHYLSPYA